MIRREFDCIWVHRCSPKQTGYFILASRCVCVCVCVCLSDSRLIPIWYHETSSPSVGKLLYLSFLFVRGPQCSLDFFFLFFYGQSWPKIRVDRDGYPSAKRERGQTEDKASSCSSWGRKKKKKGSAHMLPISEEARPIQTQAKRSQRPLASQPN